MLKFNLGNREYDDVEAKLVVTAQGYLVLELEREGVIAISPLGRLHKLKNICKPNVDTVAPDSIIASGNDLHYSHICQ